MTTNQITGRRAFGGFEFYHKVTEATPMARNKNNKQSTGHITKASKAKTRSKDESLKAASATVPEPEKVVQRECPVVGFGASAGGLEAFTEVLQHMPENPGF